MSTENRITKLQKKQDATLQAARDAAKYIYRTETEKRLNTKNPKDDFNRHKSNIENPHDVNADQFIITELNISDIYDNSAFFYTTGELTQVKFYDSTTLVLTVDVTWTTGKITGVVRAYVGGKTETITITYDGDEVDTISKVIT